MIDPVSFTGVEDTIHAAVGWLRLVIETIGAVVVGTGFLIGAWMYVRSFLAHQTRDYNGIRLILARYLALALEFQLASDILSTAVAPSWEAIGKLAAIAAIRTGLNYFLSQEMEQEHEAEARRAQAQAKLS